MGRGPHDDSEGELSMTEKGLTRQFLDWCYVLETLSHISNDTEARIVDAKMKTMSTTEKKFCAANRKQQTQT
jgi:hypothetical protein